MMGFPGTPVMKGYFAIFKDIYLSTPILLKNPGLLFGFLSKSYVFRFLVIPDQPTLGTVMDDDCLLSLIGVQK